MKIKLENLQLKMIEKFSFESKNENEKGKIIEGYFLTFRSETDSDGRYVIIIYSYLEY